MCLRFYALDMWPDTVGCWLYRGGHEMLWQFCEDMSGCLDVPWIKWTHSLSQQLGWICSKALTEHIIESVWPRYNLIPLQKGQLNNISQMMIWAGLLSNARERWCIHGGVICVQPGLGQSSPQFEEKANVVQQPSHNMILWYSEDDQLNTLIHNSYSGR